MKISFAHCFTLLCTPSLTIASVSVSLRFDDFIAHTRYDSLSAESFDDRMECECTMPHIGGNGRRQQQHQKSTNIPFSHILIYQSELILICFSILSNLCIVSLWLFTVNIILFSSHMVCTVYMSFISIKRLFNFQFPILAMDRGNKSENFAHIGRDMVCDK